MTKLQVLVATMNRRDFRIMDEMNLKCDAIIANQTNFRAITVNETPFGSIKMISTDTRGVGLNRNIALTSADADIVLFSDDDVTYFDGVFYGVIKAFEEIPSADVIIFSIDYIKNGEVIERRRLSKRRLHLWNSLKYGAASIAVKRKSVMDAGIRFSEKFGGGCIYSSGEDSLFLKSCFDKGLKIYSHDCVLGTCSKDSSSWFTGCDEKYFYDKGALMFYLFPKMKYFMTLRFAVRSKKPTEIGAPRRIRLMYAGLLGGGKLIPYSRMKKGRE